MSNDPNADLPLSNDDERKTIREKRITNDELVEQLEDMKGMDSEVAGDIDHEALDRFVKTRHERWEKERESAHSEDLETNPGLEPTTDYDKQLHRFHSDVLSSMVGIEDMFDSIENMLGTVSREIQDIQQKLLRNRII